MEKNQSHNLKSLKDIEIELESYGMPNEAEFASEENREPASENNKSYISQKETILYEVLNSLPKKKIHEIINIFGGKEKDKEIPAEISRLNPEIEILTKKDPDELITQSNDKLKKNNNSRNRNQPL